ncbi:cell division initiation protein [Carnobacterium iners]|uniref:Cell division initiation protein n=1 Tax=Carnobacterium iners TaxID=1073423 RepID=A0A1X7NN61_9LACT|nr:DivIVA domain-containing protein [Carnobacterium iners]SEK30907.1 cell division initiation protein [Carnobacterium iners]SMH39397.1 cell division initiation protein [Carnobacterium iners]
MVLTPLDIHNKEFRVKMRGYDQDEVNDYLDQIIKDYEMVLKENRELEKNLKFSEEKVTHYNNLQDALNKSIIVAQDAADRLKENSIKEAELIGLEAETNANRLLDEAVDKAKKIATETDELRKQSKIFKQRLQLMLESQLEMVKNEEWEDILKPLQDDILKIPTLRALFFEIEHGEDQEEMTEIVNDEELEDNENQNIEGMTPAIELP